MRGDSVLHLLAHFKTVCLHRRLVRRYCFRLGLYWQGLTHDLSKFSPVEFLSGAKYYQGNRSPNDAQRRECGYSAAWLHHKGRNRHHFEYWTDYGEGGIVGVEMPPKYLAEMFCDRLAASMVYRGESYTRADPYDFFLRGRGRRLLLHPATAERLEKILLVYRDQGEDAAVDYVRTEVLGKKPRKAPGNRKGGESGNRERDD